MHSFIHSSGHSFIHTKQQQNHKLRRGHAYIHCSFIICIHSLIVEYCECESRWYGTPNVPLANTAHDTFQKYTQVDMRYQAPVDGWFTEVKLHARCATCNRTWADGERALRVCLFNNIGVCHH